MSAADLSRETLAPRGLRGHLVRDAVRDALGQALGEPWPAPVAPAVALLRD